MVAAIFIAILKGVTALRNLKKYKPTWFKAKDSHYDADAADFAVAFIESLCHTKGTWARKPFELIDWQEQIIRDIFGTLKPSGYRQFNTAYIEIPKKQGKSELAAAVALLLTCGDNEERAEVYGCAADRQQASIVFDVAADMVQMCPALAKRVKILTSQKRIIYIPTNSFYQVLSAEAYSKHGFNIHGVVFDELHTQPNRKLFDVMTKGSGDARMQPLYFLITTAGTDTNSICYEIHQKALDILEGRKIDPTFYPVIYGADESDDWTDPKVWKKANPSLGITVGLDKVKAACESAKQTPGEENSFRQLRLNQWVKQAIRWMPMTNGINVPLLSARMTWKAASATAVLIFPVQRILLLLRWCSRRLMKRTNSAFCHSSGCRRKPSTCASAVTMFPMMYGNGRDICRPPRAMWCIMATLRSSSKNWENCLISVKLLLTVGVLCRWCRTLRAWGLRQCPLDRALRICPHRPRTPPTKDLMKLTLEQKLAHGVHPVLRWMMDNIYIRTDPTGNIKAYKEKSTEKIDGAIATIMALDRAIRCGNDAGESVYDTRGLLVFLR